IVEHEVAHVAVAVVDEHRRRAAVVRARDRRVRLRRHPFSGALVVVAGAPRLVDVDHAGHAFHVDRDVDEHATDFNNVSTYCCTKSAALGRVGWLCSAPVKSLSVAGFAVVVLVSATATADDTIVLTPRGEPGPYRVDAGFFLGMPAGLPA